MAVPLQHESPGGDALWRAGRNLLCFQQIEAALKALLPTVHVRGTAAEIEAQIQQRRKEGRKASLGELAGEYERQMLKTGQQQPAPEPLSEDAVVLELSRSIDAPAETLKEMRSQWRRLVKERNILVHSMLVSYDCSTVDGAAKLSDALDAQYGRARQLLDRLAHHRSSAVLAASIFGQLVESGQLDDLQAEP